MNFHDPTEGKGFAEGGLNWFTAGLFIVAQLAGGGIVALPTAMIQSGVYTGILLNIILLGMAASTSIMLGKCWVLLRRRWPHIYRDRHCREPYPEMCTRALGPKFRKLVSICIQISQFEIAVVFMLLSSKNIQHFLKAFFRIEFSFCLLILVLALLLFPFTLLKSPEDFWWAAVISAFTTTFAVILICIGSVLDSSQCLPNSVGMPPHFHIANYFLALGTFLFAYGGHPGFPTVQHDMRRPEEFTKSSILAFLVLGLLYFPTCLLGYFVYGNSLRESIMNSMQHVWIQHAASFLITGHAIFSVIIVINPINQIAEKNFNVPQEFGPKRLLVRGVIFALVVFVAESIPTFGPLLDLSGGSTQNLTALIFPCICYLFLKVGEQKAKNREMEKNEGKRISEMGIGGLQFYSSKIYDENPQIGFYEQTTISDVLTLSDRKVLFLCIFIIAFGLLGGGAATFSAIRELTFTHFVAPCYISLFLKPENESSSEMMGTINCCGPGQNISIRGEPEKFCSKQDLHFYD